MRLPIQRRTFVETLLSFAAAPAALAATRSLLPERQQKASPRIIVLDVNETLLDVSALEPLFARVFGNAGVVQDWFSTVLLYSQVTTIAGPYANFGQIARASLQMAAAARGLALAPADEADILKGLVSLPAHPDVHDGLEKLRTAGFRLVTLTNSTPTAVEQQLKNAGINDYIERKFSVDTVRLFKPAPEVYHYVATELRVSPAQLRIVAAHAWDVLGAMRAGCSAAFIARPGKVLYPLAEKPDITGRDLRAVADEIVRRDSPK